MSYGLDWILLAFLAGLAGFVALRILAARRPADEPAQADRGRGAGVWSRPMAGYRLLVRQAGLNPPGDWYRLLVLKLAAALGLPLLVAEVLGMALGVIPSWTVLAVLAIPAFLLPDAWLLQTRNRRRHRIRRSLSYFLDLVVALLQSGMTLEQALLRAARDGFSGPHPLADEVRLIGRELDIGKDRGPAFLSLSERTGVPELRSVAAALRSGAQSGSRLEDTLATQADLLRFSYRERALQRLNHASVVAMVPVFLCGVPIYLVLVFFPAFLEIIDMLHVMRPW